MQTAVTTLVIKDIHADCRLLKIMPNYYLKDKKRKTMYVKILQSFVRH
jgi:hypothetical protein